MSFGDSYTDPFADPSAEAEASDTLVPSRHPLSPIYSVNTPYVQNAGEADHTLNSSFSLDDPSPSAKVEEAVPKFPEPQPAEPAAPPAPAPEPEPQPTFPQPQVQPQPQPSNTESSAPTPIVMPLPTLDEVTHSR